MTNVEALEWIRASVIKDNYERDSERPIETKLGLCVKLSHLCNIEMITRDQYHYLDRYLDEQQPIDPVTGNHQWYRHFFWWPFNEEGRLQRLAIIDRMLKHERDMEVEPIL